MSGYPGGQGSPSVAGTRTVLLATEKAFAAGAVNDIDSTFKSAGYALKKLENYKEEQQLLDAIADVDAVIIRSDIASAKVMDAGKKLKLIVRAGAGYDNIDLPAAAERNIITMNTPGANANAVAELAFGMMIANARNQWDGSSGYELSGKTLAVYGFGAVARNLHRIAKGFGMTFSAYDPYLTKEQIEGAGAVFCGKVEELFDSQFVSLHCPATDETKNSINYALMSKMPKNAVLVNTARPEVVHEADLKKIVEERKDFAYVADVPPKNLADLHALPDGAKRVFVTKKKMGAQTAEANSNAGIQAAQQIVGFFERGEMRGQVKPPPPPPGSKTVLLATEKAFAAGAVSSIASTFADAGYTLKKLENYKEEQQLLDAIADVDAVIIRSDIASAKVMDAGKKLKLIVRAGAGYDNIDLPAAAERKIITMNTPGANANAVAELAFGMMIANARNNWDGSSGYELSGKTLAVYGFGAVARNLQRIAKAIGMTFSAYDPYLTKEQIEGAGATYCAKVEELFDSQFVSLHCPATDETKNSINYALLSKLPKNGVLVNTARPEVVHEADLKRVFEERKDFAYLADVPPKNLSELNALSARVLVTKKKMGAQTAEANSNAGTQAARQIVGFFERGEMRGQVKP